MTTPADFVGPAGEALVRFDLLRHGVANHTSSAGSSFDLVAEVGSRLIRVEVKTTATASLKFRGAGIQSRKQCYYFSLQADSSARYDKVEVFAFVVLDLQRVLYVPWYDFDRRSKAKWFGRQQFDDVDASFAHCFKDA